jgi:hypothetical protein
MDDRREHRAPDGERGRPMAKRTVFRVMLMFGAVLAAVVAGGAWFRY